MIRDYDKKKFEIKIPIHKTVQVPHRTRYWYDSHFNKWEPSNFLYIGWVVMLIILKILDGLA